MKFVGKPEVHERALSVLSIIDGLFNGQYPNFCNKSSFPISPANRFYRSSVLQTSFWLPADSPLFCRKPLSSLALAPPRARLSLISRHLEQRPQLEINTPFSTERLSREPDDIDYTPIKRDPPRHDPAAENKKMSQAEHPALLIPGPIEFDDEVLQSMGHFRFVRTCNPIQRSY